MKRCKHCGRHPVFSHGYCRYHQYIREDDKYKRMADKTYKSTSKPLSRPKGYKIPPMSEKRREELKTRSQMDVFREIWDELPQPIICPVSGRRIGYMENTDYWHWCFAHILSKKQYPKYKLLKENIMVVDTEVHQLYDQGTQEQRDKKKDWNWDILYSKREELKKRYANH